MALTDIPPEKLASLSRNDALYWLAHEILHRIIAVEGPGALRIEEHGSSLFTTTDEGAFLGKLVDTITLMNRNNLKR